MFQPGSAWHIVHLPFTTSVPLLDLLGRESLENSEGEGTEEPDCKRQGPESSGAGHVGREKLPQLGRLGIRLYRFWEAMMVRGGAGFRDLSREVQLCVSWSSCVQPGVFFHFLYRWYLVEHSNHFFLRWRCDRIQGWAWGCLRVHSAPRGAWSWTVCENVEGIREYAAVAEMATMLVRLGK